MSFFDRAMALVVRLLGMKPDRPKDEHELLVSEAPRLYVVANRPVVRK